MSEVTIVKMGQLAVSSTPGHVLMTIGLGSCIGLVLLDRRGTAAGLAHVMLPGPAREGGAEAKFADTAVPALVAMLHRQGAPRTRLHATLVGGAQMFSSPEGRSSTLDVGARNEAAVRAELERVGIPVVAAATSGRSGRTVRVHVAEGVVTVKEAGGSERELLAARRNAIRDKEGATHGACTGS